MIIGSFIVSGCASSNPEQSNEEHNDSHNTHAQPTLKYVLGSNDWASVTSLTNDPKILEAYICSRTSRSFKLYAMLLWLL